MLRAHALSLGVVTSLVVLLIGCEQSSDFAGSAPASKAETTSQLESLEESYRYVAPPSADAPAASEATPAPHSAAPANVTSAVPSPAPAEQPSLAADPTQGQGPGQAGDRYALIEESPFLQVKTNPLSTFSIDVDTASYAKTRAYLLNQRMLPPPDAVRIEELVNYFDYDYAGPTDSHPFAVHLESAECPWKTTNRLVRIGIQAKRIDDQPHRANLVFLIDVSGSMDAPNKLPLVKRGLQMLVRQLGENDRIAMVVYAGSAGMVLPPNAGNNHATILAALDRLQAGGSTNGGEGIQLAYKIAAEQKIEGGVNRVILCTDGDFNVGMTGTGDLVQFAAERAKQGIHLSVLGFGMGNHNDAMLEALADKANGNYGYIDSDKEAHKLLVEQMSGTLVTVAQDVKIQVEFNPAQVAGYRLIGYENRRLADRDFNDDTKDAGEIGAGHSVTALYEVVPISQAKALIGDVDPLKYQQPKASESDAPQADDSSSESSESPVSSELLTVKLRYQPPGGGKSTLITQPLTDSDHRFGQASPDFQFATSVAAFGMLLRGSQHRGDATYDGVLEIASATRGEDRFGYRAEFLELVKAASELNAKKLGAVPATPKWEHGVVAVATPVYSQPVVLRCGTVDPPTLSARLTGFWRRMPEGLFTGMVLGVGLTVMALAGGVYALSRYRDAATQAAWPSELPPAKKLQA